MVCVTYDGATRRHPGTERPAVHRLDLAVADDDFLVGPSGCGTSRSLRMLAGLEEVDAGRLLIGDRDVADAAPTDRDIAMVFQSYALTVYVTAVGDAGGLDVDAEELHLFDATTGVRLAG